MPESDNIHTKIWPFSSSQNACFVVLNVLDVKRKINVLSKVCNFATHFFIFNNQYHNKHTINNILCVFFVSLITFVEIPNIFRKLSCDFRAYADKVKLLYKCQLS